MKKTKKFISGKYYGLFFRGQSIPLMASIDENDVETTKKELQAKFLDDYDSISQKLKAKFTQREYEEAKKIASTLIVKPCVMGRMLTPRKK